MPSLTRAAEASTVLTGIVAVLALAGAVWQVRVGRRSQREATASAHYASYLQLAVEHPMLAGGHIQIPEDPRNQPVEDFERYEWFVSVMLHAFEEILDLIKKDKEWHQAMADQIRYHHAYLSSEWFVAEHYSDELQALIRTTMSRR